MTLTALIIGAGPSGLVMAHELARQGVSCRIVEKSALRAQQSRAIAIQARTLEVFDIMGVVNPFLALGVRAHAGRICSGHRPIARIVFDELDSRYPYVLFLPQDETERLLEAHAGRFGVAVERPVELVAFTQDDHGVTARLAHADGNVEEIRVDWLIGCDGAHSTVRHLSGLPFAGATYEDIFMLADVHADAPLDPSEFHIFTAPDGLLALFPLGDGRWRVVADRSPASWEAEPTLAQCQALIDERGPGHVRVRDSLWLARFRIHRRHAPHLQQGRVFLVSDAAHIHSPAGGQGMNTGIQDAFNLAWKLSLVMLGAADRTLLNTYEAERLPIDEAVIRQTDRLTRLATLRSPVARLLRDHLIPLVSSLASVQKKLRQTLSQLAVHYHDSPIVEEHALGGGPVAGDRAPDAALARADTGASVRLFELFAEGKHTLLLLSGEPAKTDAIAALGSLRETVHERFGEHVRAHLIGRAIAEKGIDVIDVDRSLTRHYGGKPSVYLVRPDGYIGFRCALDGAEGRLFGYLTKVFLPTRRHR